MMKRANKKTMLFMAVAFVSPLIFSTASANSTMDALLKSGAELQVVRQDGTKFTVKFTSDGRYVTSAGAKGRWALDGETLCTLRDADSDVDGRAGKSSCGEFPTGKALGDVWTMPSKSGEDLTISIVKTTD